VVCGSSAMIVSPWSMLVCGGGSSDRVLLSCKVSGVEGARAEVRDTELSLSAQSYALLN
jgi:hypothetical protein